MIHDKRSQYVSRDSVLGLLSDEEVALVSTAEVAEIGTVLPRRAIDLATWGKILTRLEANPQASTK